MTKPGVIRLQGVVQHYDWGGHEFIPRLLGVTNSGRRPFAELWMGAHPKAPSLAEVEGVAIPLDKLLAQAPEAFLGPVAFGLFDGRLPYLFKVLDVAKMLSIQAHPTRMQAKEGFARENAGGIGLQSDTRNYKDDNHKPEIGVALTDFWMLHGFRPLEEIRENLQTVPELGSVMPDFAGRLANAGENSPARHELLRELYSRFMTLPQERVDALLRSLLVRLKSNRPAAKDNPDCWAVRASESFPLPGGHYDRGIFSIYLLNLVHLRPGQGTFQPAGVLHAYLEGVNIELMANSDNVLRGGLTPKHVDVPELLRILTFASNTPQVLDGIPVGITERVYPTAAEEFELTRIDLRPGFKHNGHAAQGPDCILLLDGSAVLTTQERNLPLTRGCIVFAPFDTHYALETRGGNAVLFRASLPQLAARSAEDKT